MCPFRDFLNLLVRDSCEDIIDRTHDKIAGKHEIAKDYQTLPQIDNEGEVLHVAEQVQKEYLEEVLRVAGNLYDVLVLPEEL